MRESNVLIHDEAGFQGMRKAGALAADCLLYTSDAADES